MLRHPSDTWWKVFCVCVVVAFALVHSWLHYECARMPCNHADSKPRVLRSGECACVESQ